MSTRVRILSFVLFASLAVFATVSAAGARQATPRTVSAVAHRRGPMRLGARRSPRSAREQRGLFASDPQRGFGSALVGSAPVQPGPSAVAVNPTTNTIYVANGNNANGPTSPGGDTISVIDGRRCSAHDVSRCKGPWPTVNVGGLPSTVAVDQATDTVYVTIDSSDTVAVFNGAICNGRVTSGCGQAPAHVPVGPGPFGIVADDSNHTVYVGNPGPNFDQDTMSMINTSTCNGSDLAGCASQTPVAVAVGVAPGDFDINQTTHTVYVAIYTGVAAFDADTCNATVMSGCNQIGTLSDPAFNPSLGVPSVAIDDANNTIYAANANNTISAFDGSTCDANDLAGCGAEAPGVVTVAAFTGFAVSFWLVVDAPLHTVYVVNQKDDNLAAVDANVCNGGHLSACADLVPPTVHTATDPESLALNEQTQTLYTANQVDNDVSVIDAATCNSEVTSGCGHPAPVVAIPGAGGVAVDATVHTVYVSSGANSLSMINTESCNAGQPTGCAQRPLQVTVGENPSAVAVDGRTDTVYVANFGSGTTPGAGTVSVIDAATCNATNSGGCAVSTLQVPGGNATDLAVDAATDTLYVATITDSGPNLLSVFNGGSCNATNATGCNQTPATLPVGDSGGAFAFSALSIAVDQTTNTVYATNLVFTPFFVGNAVYVIDGATCDAELRSGCGQTPATVTVPPAATSSDPSNPWGIAVNQATNTIYTADIANGEGPGSVSVINGVTCNGQNQGGCDQTPALAPSGFGALGIAIDDTTDKVYVTNQEDASVSIIDGAACNGHDANGCSQTPPAMAVGEYPGSIAVDPTTGTVYVADAEGVSVSPLDG